MSMAVGIHNYSYSDSFDSIPPSGFKVDDPMLNDGSGRNLSGTLDGVTHLLYISFALYVSEFV